VSGSAITRRRIARVVAAKDLRIEVRSQVLTNQVLQFAGVTMVLFAFALDALRVAGVDPVAIFWGKSIALAAQLAVLELVLLVADVVLYGASLPLGGVVLLVTTMLTATCGLACVGTLYGGLTAGFTGRETLLPLLVLPVVAPVLIGATRAVEAALGTGRMALSEGWPWIGLLGVFAVAFGVGGALAFGPLIDEAN
jgi:heme exporter protein B